jgi:hypothetical protein
LRLSHALFLVGCAGRALAQHAGHIMNAAGATPPRFDFSVAGVYADHGSLRGDRKLGLRDWEMFQSPTQLGGRLSFRAMTSVGGLLDHEGLPSLLQTGGSYQHAYIHDRQHPDDVVMEAAGELRLGPGFLSVAPIGAPALGPAAYLHRPSAAGDLSAPVGHHWQDATHVSYGVVTVGMRANGLTLETSVFNARESDFKAAWPDFSHGRLDSFSGRATFSASGFTVSSWWGYLKAHDPLAPAMQMHRFGASASLDLERSSTLAAWGMNVHHHDGSSHALLHGDPNASPHVRSSSVLLESTMKASDRLAVFGRAERVMKNGEELGFLGGDLMALHEIRAISLGARRDFATVGFACLAVGARGSVSLLPSSLELAYGTRRPKGFDVFLQARRLP